MTTSLVTLMAAAKGTELALALILGGIGRLPQNLVAPVFSQSTRLTSPLAYRKKRQEMTIEMGGRTSQLLMKQKMGNIAVLKDVGFAF